LQSASVVTTGIGDTITAIVNLTSSWADRATSSSYSYIIPTYSGSLPGTPLKGTITYNTASNFLYVFNGNAWKSASFS
jgi:hypothetical protein